MRSACLPRAVRPPVRAHVRTPTAPLRCSRQPSHHHRDASLARRGLFSCASPPLKSMPPRMQSILIPKSSLSGVKLLSASIDLGRMAIPQRAYATDPQKPSATTGSKPSASGYSNDIDVEKLAKEAEMFMSPEEKAHAKAAKRVQQLCRIAISLLFSFLT